MTYKILLAGDGGQGIQLISDVICHSAFYHDREVSQIPNYGLEQRGGVSLAFIQIGTEPIAYPKFNRPDLLLIMSPQAHTRTLKYQTDTVMMIRVDDHKKFLEQNSLPLSSYNIFFLGLIIHELSEKKLVSLDIAEEYLTERLSSKNNWPANQSAFKLGLNYR